MSKHPISWQHPLIDYLGNEAACPAYIKSCIPAVDPMDGCPNFCPVFCDPVTEEICDGVGFLPGTTCSQPDFCVPIGTSCPPW